MDFFGELPEGQGFNAILVVTDRFTKMRHLIPCRTCITAKETAVLFFNYIFKLYGLPDSIVSDRGTQFVSYFWKALCDTLRVQDKLSTAYHPETYGQTERFNAVMEQYLPCYTAYRQDDWTHWLSFAEFSANKHVSASTQLSPFAVNYGFNPCFITRPSTIAPQSNSAKLDTRAASSFVEHITQIQDFLREQMRYSQHVNEAQANRHRSGAPSYQVGDEVWLLTTNVKTNWPSQNLDYKKIRRYKIKRVVSPYAYELDLPHSLQIHPVFHTSVLRPAADDPGPGQSHQSPPPIFIERPEGSALKYHVQAVAGSRYNRKYDRFEYELQRLGYDRTTWEPISHLNGAQDLVQAYHIQYPDATHRQSTSSRRRRAPP